MMRAVVFTLAVLSICCGGGTASSPTAIDFERLTLRVQTTHFQIFVGNRTCVSGIFPEDAHSRR